MTYNLIVYTVTVQIPDKSGFQMANLCPKVEWSGIRMPFKWSAILFLTQTRPFHYKEYSFMTIINKTA